jgi:capsule polysaccharide export protein KpsC/LpsZ
MKNIIKKIIIKHTFFLTLKNKIKNKIIELFNKSFEKKYEYIEFINNKNIYHFIKKGYLPSSNINPIRDLKSFSLLVGFSNWKFFFIEKFIKGKFLFSTKKINFINLFFHILFAPTKPKNIYIWGYEIGHWALLVSKIFNIKISRVEDGYLRSFYLGKEHNQANSLVIDNESLHFDKNGKSIIHELISEEIDEKITNQHAEYFIKFCKNNFITKYSAINKTHLKTIEQINNLFPAANFIGVVGQKPNDKSMIYGNPKSYSNFSIFYKALKENKDSIIIFKQHPDVVDNSLTDILVKLFCIFSKRTFFIKDKFLSPIYFINRSNVIYTISSTIGFEALIHDKKTVVFGTPFYAGYGLTEDRVKIERKKKLITKEQLIYNYIYRYCKYSSNINKYLEFLPTINKKNTFVSSFYQEQDSEIILLLQVFINTPTERNLISILDFIEPFKDINKYSILFFLKNFMDGKSIDNKSNLIFFLDNYTFHRSSLKSISNQIIISLNKNHSIVKFITITKKINFFNGLELSGLADLFSADINLFLENINKLYSNMNLTEEQLELTKYRAINIRHKEIFKIVKTTNDKDLYLFSLINSFKNLQFLPLKFFLLEQNYSQLKIREILNFLSNLYISNLNLGIVLFSIEQEKYYKALYFLKKLLSRNIISYDIYLYHYLSINIKMNNFDLADKMLKKIEIFNSNFLRLKIITNAHFKRYEENLKLINHTKLMKKINISPVLYRRVYNSLSMDYEMWSCFNQESIIKTLKDYFKNNYLSPSNKIINDDLLIISLWGPGDEIRFASIYNLIFSKFFKNKGKKLYITCDPRLEDIFKFIFPEITFIPVKRLRDWEFLPDCRDKIFKESLYRIFNNDVIEKIEKENLDVCSITEFLPIFYPTKKMPFSISFLNNYFKEEKSNKFINKKLKVGICWRSSLISSERSIHYLKLNMVKNLIKKNTEIDFYSLQYDNCDEEISDINKESGLIKIFKNKNLKDNFKDLATSIRQMDLVIAPANTIAEFSGALGHKTILFTFGDELNYRIGNNLQDIWFPSIKIIQTNFGDTEKMLSKLNLELSELLKNE